MRLMFAGGFGPSAAGTQLVPGGTVAPVVAIQVLMALWLMAGPGIAVAPSRFARAKP